MKPTKWPEIITISIFAMSFLFTAGLIALMFHAHHHRANFYTMLDDFAIVFSLTAFWTWLASIFTLGFLANKYRWACRAYHQLLRFVVVIGIAYLLLAIISYVHKISQVKHQHDFLLRAYI
ncbi:hypothetical protein JD969_12810 [Planctomycetota bacterium]|nr:hypothetical protein JD969_12810 [Planctomycetota bacterium]